MGSSDPSFRLNGTESHHELNFSMFLNFTTISENMFRSVFVLLVGAYVLARVTCMPGHGYLPHGDVIDQIDNARAATSEGDIV